MSNKFNDLQPRYDRDESPREWYKPPIAVVCVSVLLLLGSIWLGIALTNDMETLAETYKFDRKELPLLKLLIGYMTLPFAVVCAVFNCSFFYYNVKGVIVRLFSLLSNKTFKFGK